MKRMAIAGSIMLLTLAGCSGFDIKPISADEAKNAHAAHTIGDGYVIYAPVVVVEIGSRRACLRKDSKGNCEEEEIRCVAGTPFVLPDRSKPYLINFRSGFAKAGVDVAIADGWRLNGVKDAADNQSVLGVIGKLAAGVSLAPAKAGEGDNAVDGECKPGLYRVEADAQGVGFVRIPGP